MKRTHRTPAHEAVGRERALPKAESRTPNAEKDDLLSLALAFVVVPVLWLALGWTPSLLFGSLDGTQIDLPAVRELLYAGGDWHRMLYRTTWVGGAKLWDVGGGAWPTVLCARLGLPAAWVENAFPMLIQALQGFLLLRLAQDLARLWGRPVGMLPVAVRLMLIVLVAFTPMAGWKLSRAHAGMMAGTLVFVAGLCVAAAGAAGTLTAVLFVAAVAPVAAALQSSLQQPVLYGAVFGLPILAGVLWARGRVRTGIPPAAAACLAGLGLALPTFSLLVANALGSDSARTVGGTNVVYSYLTGTVRDLAASLPWSLEAIATGREELLLHEVNVPLGPPLLVLALVPWKRALPLGIGLAASFALAALFALNVHPFSDALLALPMMGSFRVPTRALMTVATVLPAVAAAALLYRVPRPSGTRYPVIAGAAVLAAVQFSRQGPVALEVTVAAAVAVCVAAALVLQSAEHRSWSIAILLTVLAAGSFAGFRQRMLPFPDAPQIAQDLDNLHREVLWQAPDLESPLVRAAVVADVPPVYTNAGAAAGISSPMAYLFPPRRTLELYLAAAGWAFEPTVVNLNRMTLAAGFPVLQPLFNIRWAVTRSPAGALSVSRTGDTAGPAWFSRRVVPKADIPSIAADVRAASPNVAAIASELRVSAADPVVQKLGPDPGDYPLCAQARVLEARSPDRQAVFVDVESPGICPLTISTGYAGILRATWTGADGTVRDLAVYPAYGALSGVLVPPGRGQVRLAPVLEVPAWARAAQVLGLLVLVGTTAAILRRRAAA